MLIFAFSVMSLVMSTAAVALVAEFKLPSTTEEWVYSVLVGIFGLFGQCLLAVALRRVQFQTFLHSIKGFHGLFIKF